MDLRDIAIVGYGTAGQALAIALARDGHRVRVFEQAPQPGPVGAGFLLQPTGMAALWSLGLLDAARACGTPVDRLHGENARGRVVMDMRYADLDRRLSGLGMQRGALFEVLRAALPPAVELHAGRRIVAVDAAQGRLTDADGRCEGPFDLVVAADGAGSRLRGGLPSTRLDQPYPWGAVWCLLPLRDWPHPHELRQRYRAARQMLGLLPVGTRPGDPTPRMSFFWSVPAQAFDDWAALPLEHWHAQMIDLWPQFAPHLADLQDRRLLARASYRDVILGARWHHGRLLLLGDAAHAMSPQLGQGVNMALLDALALRDALRTAQPLEAALAGFAAARRAHIRAYQFWSRWLTPLFQSDLDWPATLRDWLFHPLGRLPGSRLQALRILTGTRRGWFGRWPLPAGFVESLAQP
ncbi:MAG: FAD-dependent monooxygenase [Rhodanobacteraceae bacterium]|nr:FAD-dependent monooxygenase [Rhodanobacteraceae bacterium]